MSEAEKIQFLAASLERMSSLSCRMIGPVLVMIGMSLVATVAFCALFVAPVVPPELGLVRRAGLLSPGLWILFNIYFNWYYCMMTDPGSPRRDEECGALEVDLEASAARSEGQSDRLLSRRAASAAEEGVNHASRFARGRPSTATGYCLKCDAPKPPRTRHCSTCDKCILGFDHHCPWMNNCIGFHNHRYFLLFLVYLSLGCLYMVCITLAFYSLNDIAEGKLGRTRQFEVILPAAVLVTSTVFVIFQFHLVLTGQTTLDMYIHRGRGRRAQLRPFDLGITRNWRAMMGPGVLAWLLPSHRPRPGDGVTWPTCKSVVAPQVV
mmetsp:Transcript_24051/g.42448  ORF Transcript_24051/g.42448 Transcript_24051/m.42448 type:complete len:322 (-) Transcript_24051:270-1235(-)